MSALYPVEGSDVPEYPTLTSSPPRDREKKRDRERDRAPTVVDSVETHNGAQVRTVQDPAHKATVTHHRNFLAAVDEPLAERVLLHALREVDFHELKLVFFGKPVVAPRLVAEYKRHAAVVDYKYSRQTTGAVVGFPAWLDELVAHCAVALGRPADYFNYVLFNLYRSAHDKIDKHSDDERGDSGMAPGGIIVSLSLGPAVRNFDLHPKQGGARLARFELRHGDAIVMNADSQRTWVHSLPALSTKSKKSASGDPSLELESRDPSLESGSRDPSACGDAAHAQVTTALGYDPAVAATLRNADPSLPGAVLAVAHVDHLRLNLTLRRMNCRRDC